MLSLIFYVVLTKNKAQYPLVDRFLSFEEIKGNFTSLSRMFTACRQSYSTRPRLKKPQINLCSESSLFMCFSCFLMLEMSLSILFIFFMSCPNVGQDVASLVPTVQEKCPLLLSECNKGILLWWSTNPVPELFTWKPISILPRK